MSWVETPYGRMAVDPAELVIGRLLDADGKLPTNEREVAFMRAHIQPGDSVIDVGANYGWFSLAMGRMITSEGSDGWILSIEPNPPIHDLLVETLGAAKVAACYPPVALGASESRGTIRLDSRGSGGTQIIDNGADGEYDVQIHTLDDVVFQYLPGPVRFIKIDTEGMDVDVLRGARTILKEERPFVIFEWNAEAMTRLGKDPLKELVDLIWICAEVDYRFTDLGGNDPPLQLAGNLFLVPQ